MQKQSLMTSILLFGLGLAVTSLAQASSMSPEAVEGTNNITTQQAFDLFKRGSLFVDVRDYPAWEAGRIPGAVHLELKKMFNEANLHDEATKDEAIVIYCNGPKCHRSAKACSKAVKWGYKNVHYYREGYPAWQAANYPTE